ncbi:MAG: fused MFS/spermidine synthase [Janthinobacterium lividum]
MRGTARSPGGLYVLTICSGSFLLFLVEPLVARVALPRLGGAAAVWNSAMLVYQSLLLAGYAYAHRLARLGPATQRWVHGAVLLAAAAWLPIGIAARDLPPGATPELWVPWLFGLSVGPLFFAVAAQAPLLQRWYAITCPDREPYPLYAASNLGSFGGLLAYPLIAEPLIGIAQQRWFWSAGYLLLVVLTGLCAARLPRGAMPEQVVVTPAPNRRLVGRWIVLAFVPSGLMLATSTYVTTDVVAMPLLWALPLGVYLLSFVAAFAGRRWLADRVTGIAPLVLLLMGGVMMGGYQPRALFGLAVALTVLFAASVALHTALYRCRPAPDRLTAFYLAVAVGGALGGVFCGLVAPVVFDWTWEYPLLILAAGAMLPLAWPGELWRRLWDGRGRRAVLLSVAAVILVAVLAMRMCGVAGLGETEQGNAYLVVALLGIAALGERTGFVLVLAGTLAIFGGWRSALLSWQPGARERSYFGVYAIRDDGARGHRTRELASGTTTHGIELTGSAARERTPTTYYVPGSGVGQAMAAAPNLYGAGARVGVVGLGSGTLACYAQPGQRWTFLEIDPTVVRIARDRFRFLADCDPGARIVVGDARLALARQPDASLDLLALDAFSSDAIPIHLMTREAFDGYGRVLPTRGLLLVHVSNRFVDLEPVVAAAARAGGWSAIVLRYTPAPDEEAASLSEWIALSRSPAVLDLLKARDAEWEPLAGRPGFRPWTDDRATVLPLVKRLD